MKTLIADDDQAIREGLRSIVEDLGAEIVAEAEDGDAAVKNAKACSPELILLDVSMPVMNGLTAARLLHEMMPQVAIILVSQHNDHLYAEEAMRIGAKGFVLKRYAVTDLAAAIPVVMAGGVFVSPSIASRTGKQSA